jgi:hypothetical protein
VSILIFPAYGYDHWDFEGDLGQDWHFEGTPQWHFDCDESQSGSCSMRSGEILPLSAPTSIWRVAQGPAIISFWWKADSIQVCNNPSELCTGLFFLVDGKTQLTCNSTDWKDAKFPLADGLHRIEWVFKPRFDRKSIGRLDNVSIAPSPTTTPSPIATTTVATYTFHNMSFETPEGWKVAKDAIEGNDKQVVLSDGTNSIRIDLIKHPGIGKIISDYLEYHVSKSELASLAYDLNDTNSEAWKSAYGLYPWYSNDAICDYYKENVIRTIASGGTGSGISVKPDGVEYAGVSTNANSHHEINEWVIAWTKPSYDDEIIGVHSLFKGDFREIMVEWYGSNIEYSMPEPLWTVLTTLNRGNKPLPKPTTSSSLVESV